MKKLLALLLLFSSLLLIVSCGSDNTSTTPAVTTPATSPSGDPYLLPDAVRVGYLAGTTGVGLAKLISDVKAADTKNITFTKYNTPVDIMAAVSKGDLDFAALPTNAFPGFYKQMASGVQLAAINTLGVLYLLTDGVEIDSISDLAGKTVYVPEQAPKLVLEYLLRASGVENCTLTMEYNLEALPGMIAGANADVQIALLPEPKTTAAINTAKSNGKDLTIALDLSEIWDSVSDTQLVQGCMLVKTSFAAENADTVDAFLALYEESVAFMSDAKNLSAAALCTVEAGILPSVAVATAALPRCSLTFRTGNQMKADAIGFFEALGIAAPTGTPYYGSN